MHGDAGEGRHQLDCPLDRMIGQLRANDADEAMGLFVDRIAEVNQKSTIAEGRQTELVHGPQFVALGRAP